MHNFIDHIIAGVIILFNFGRTVPERTANSY